ncbi:MAG TPA: HD domain-containing protein [Bacilli bacterium]|nr:HD domain-containing protein [Bacilli bacterium]
MENKIEKTLRFYLLATKLKEVVRTGWMQWHVSKERLESIAEHVYGTAMLAIGIDSEFKYDINIDRVIKMIVLHELEEVIIGDITPYDKTTKEEKYEIGMKAVKQILKDMIKEDEYYNLLEEFCLKTTNDALFAYMCDKLEACIQAKVYDENGYCNIFSDENKYRWESEVLNKVYKDDVKTLSDLFCLYYDNQFDENFKSITDYITQNNILK